MKKNKKISVILILTTMILTATVGCSQLDVVGRESVTTFNAVLDAMSDNVEADEVNVGWSLKAPDGTVKFIWSKDYSKSPLHDVMLEFDAKPFLDAGLDTSKLPEDIAFYEGMLMVGIKLGKDELKYKSDPTPLSSYEQIVDLYRDTIGYHTVFDHYGVDLGDGNMFEWAKDMSTNDKDIVFVLNPEPLIEAGVDPEKVKGWVYAQVPIEENGKTTQVWKFLKPYNLK